MLATQLSIPLLHLQSSHLQSALEKGDENVETLTDLGEVLGVLEVGAGGHEAMVHGREADHTCGE